MKSAKKITADIENFFHDLDINQVNLRLLYKIRSSIKGLDKETMDLADGLITSIDTYLEEGDQLRALEASSRFVGLIEGYILSLEGIEAEEVSEELLPVFKLSKTDKNRILKLCSDMRKIIFATSEFDNPHKMRLLNRVAAIELQVHQEKGFFDVILAGMSDFGETLGKFGKDIKPLTDRMNEVRRIAQSNTKEYDQIPAPDDLKRISGPADGDEDD